MITRFKSILIRVIRLYGIENKQNLLGNVKSHLTQSNSNVVRYQYYLIVDIRIVFIDYIILI